MSTRIVDKKGRLLLGSALAGRMVIVNDANPNRIVITPAVAIPENEAWLYQNVEARTRLRAGLEQARQRAFSSTPPDLAADADLADALPD